MSRNVRLLEVTSGEAPILTSPCPGLPASIVLTARGGQPRLEEIVRAFAGGPLTPEPGAHGTGGKGRP